MRLFAGDVDRGCSGTTPGRKLIEGGEKNRSLFVIFIRYFPWGQYMCADLCLSLTYSLYHECVS